MMMVIYDDPKTPECLKNLDENQRRKLITITIDNMDFLSVLSGD
jgi:hypothetical protein